MRRLRTLLGWARRLAGAVRPERGAGPVDTELETHLQLHVDDLVRGGLSPAEARRQALIALGGWQPAREALRDQRGIPLLADLATDVRHAARLLRRQPVFSAAAVLVLALGIGANAAVFGLVDGLLLRDLPVAQPEELVKFTGRGDEVLGYRFFERLKDQATTLSGVVAFTRAPGRGPTLIERAGRVEAAGVVWASTEYFAMLGVAPEVGRTFGPGTAEWSAERVAVVSHAYARERGLESSAVLGSQLRYLNRTFTIVGVMPSSFVGVEYPAPDIWIPLGQASPPEDSLWARGRFVKVMARVRPGVAHDAVAAEASTIGGENARIGVTPAATGFSSLRDRFARPVLILQGLVALVLLVACANLANLLLARGESRRREIVVRLSVGASRGRLLRQFAAESLVLGVAGGVGAVLVAFWLSQGMVALMPPPLAGAAAPLMLRFDGIQLLFVAASSLLASLLFGVLPALRVTAQRRPRLHAGAAQARGRATSRGLVIGAVALSTALVVTSGLFVRTLHNLWTSDNGFAASNVVVAEVQMPPVPQPRPTLAQYEEVAAYLRNVPETDAVGFSRIGQLTGGFIQFSITRPGESLSADEQAARPDAIEQRVSPGFLDAMGTPLLTGRDVSDSDTTTAPPVAVVNEAFVRTYLDSHSPLGQRFVTAVGEFVVVGVVKNTRWVDLRESDRPMFYRPSRQASPTGATFAIRSSRPLDLVADDLRRAGTASGVRFAEIVPFTDMVNRTLVVERLLAFVSGGVGLLALVVVGVGLYGLLAYTVEQRTREIGVRRALGAQTAHIQWSVTRDSMALMGIGVALGVLAVVLAEPLLATVLFGLTPTDTVTFGAAGVVIGLVTLLAASIPAYRASRVDPIVALRAD
ncbi:MAG: ABC transporter permease [Acidobacteria bacterium]|nr:ABC transporter permease [Acidobacteriota bacterium]